MFVPPISSTCIQEICKRMKSKSICLPACPLACLPDCLLAHLLACLLILKQGLAMQLWLISSSWFPASTLHALASQVCTTVTSLKAGPWRDIHTPLFLWHSSHLARIEGLIHIRVLLCQNGNCSTFQSEEIPHGNNMDEPERHPSGEDKNPGSESKYCVILLPETE